MGLFGKKKTEKVEVSSLVKILGSGCAKCNTLEDNTVEALKMLGKEMPVEHVTDFSKIAAYGVMTTPALVYDQKVLIAGRVAKAEEIAELLKEVMAWVVLMLQNALVLKQLAPIMENAAIA
ncbi:thioredoxin family protein [Anaerotignum lactatifermentans]